MLVFSCKAANIADRIVQELFDSFSYYFPTGEQGSRGIPGPPGEPGAKGPAGGCQKAAVFIWEAMSLPSRLCFCEHRQGNSTGVESCLL